MGGAMVEAIDAGVYVFHDGERTRFVDDCVAACGLYGLHESNDPCWAAFAIAPRLTRKLDASEYSKPNHGTLIFHPSALPYGRGPDAIRQSVLRGERVSASTWFWASDGWDEGDVCEQETVVLCPDESPGRSYHSRFVPAALRALHRLLRDWRTTGTFRRVPQDHRLATYDAAR